MCFDRKTSDHWNSCVDLKIFLLTRIYFFQFFSKRNSICFSFVALRHWEEFRLVVHQKDFPSLREFYFVICFPAHLYEQFQKTIVNTFDLPWPLNNLAYHREEQLLPHYAIDKVTKRVLLFYTSPLDILLQYTSVIFNHSFAQYSTNINRRSVKWMCNQIDNLPQLKTTLKKLD